MTEQDYAIHYEPLFTTLQTMDVDSRSHRQSVDGDDGKVYGLSAVFA